MNINRDKHNKYVAGWTPNITPSTGSETSSGPTSTVIYVGGGGSSSGGGSGTVTQQNTFMYYVMSDGTNSITQTATIPTDTAILTLIGKNGVTVIASQEKSIPETEFVSTGTNTGTYKISYNKLVTTPDPTEEVPEPQPITTYPITIAYVSGDKILTSSFDTLTLYNIVDETEQVVATYNQTQLEINGDTTGINSIVVDANNIVFSRITLSITVEEQTTIILDFAVTVNQQDILYVEGTQTEQYWKLDDNGNLYTTYNAYSTQELSAYGMGESEGTPTTGAEYLYQLKDVSDAVQTPIDKGILQYNATTSQWEVTDGSNITPDLTGYAKEDWVTQQITNQINILKGNAPENMDTLGEIAGVISSLSDKVTSLEILLEWFEWDDANNAIKALFDLYGVGEISAYGYNTQEQPSGAQYLNDLLDVTISNPTNNQILIYNGSQWVNQVLPESGLNETELAQYLTEHNYVQSSALSQYATITYVDGQVTTISNRITALVGDAPEDLDTLGEIATVIQSLEQLLDWFSFVDGRIRANYDLWSVGEVSAYGYNDQEQTIVNYLRDLKDVDVENAVSGQILVYNGSIWVSQDIPDTGLNEEQLAEYLTNNNYIQTSDLANYATQQWTNNQIQNSITALVGTAPDNLDTLGEIADQIIALQQLLDWFSFVDGKIRANYDLWGIGEISAYGVGEGSSSGGKNYLHELEDVLLGDDLASGQLLQYNGTYWVNIDKDEVGLNEEELNDYLTKNKYVTITQLNSTLQGYVTTSTFNNLKTVVDRNTTSITNINGTIVTIQSTLNNIGSDITDINNNLTNIENDIDTINNTILDFNNRLTAAENKIDDLLDWFSWDNGKVRVNYTFYGVDEISAYGYRSGSVSSGFLSELQDVQLSEDLSSGQLLQFNGNVWVNIDKDKVGLNETELANYLTQNNYLQEGDVTWSNLSGKPNTFNTTISLINDLHSSWDTLLQNTPSAYITRWPTFAEVTDKPTTLAGYGITDAYTKTETDDRYVNITGDTMTGNLILPALIANDYIRIGSTAILEYDSSNNAIKVTTSSGGTVNFYATGEVSAYGFNSSSSITGASYLEELKDVTISNLQNGQALVYDSSTDRWVNRTIQTDGIDEEALAAYLQDNQYLTQTIGDGRYIRNNNASGTTDTNSALSNAVTHNYRWSNAPYNDISSLFDITYSNDWRTQLFVKHQASTDIRVRSRHNGTTWGSWRTIAFTDSNIASATYATSAGNADTLDGMHETSFMRYAGVSTVGSANNVSLFRHTGYGYSGDGWKGNGGYLSFGTTNYVFQIQGVISGDDVFYRRCNNGTWRGWKQFAFTDSNVASATNADTVDYLHASAFARANQSPEVDLNTVNGRGIMSNATDVVATAARHYPIQEAGTLFYGTAAYSSANQIYGTYNSNRWFFRGGGSSATAKTAWKEMAFLTSNVESATRLQTARTINGTNFNGTANITTTKWGTARNIYIRDASQAHTGSAVSVDGSANEYLLLPSTITATLSGNATTSSKWATARKLTLTGDVTGSVSMDGSKNVSLATEVSDNVFTYRGRVTASGPNPTASELTDATLQGTYNVLYSGAIGKLIVFRALDSSAVYTQIYHTYAGSMMWRSSQDSTLSGKTWRTLLDTNNYTSYLDSRYVNASGDTMTGSLTVNTGTGTRIVLGSGIQLWAGSGGWARGFSAYNTSGSAVLENGNICGAHGSGNTLIHMYYGGTYDSPALTILPSNKYVGIGTTSPSYKLHVVGGIYSSEYLQIGSARLRYDSASNAVYIQKSDGSSCNFYATGEVSAYGGDSNGNTEGQFSTITVNNGEGTKIKLANNVGISASTTSSWARGLTVYNSTFQSSLWTIAGGFGGINSFTYSFYGGTYDSPAITITSNKNVGIGTTSPSYKLHVSGKAYATGGFQNGSDIRYKDIIQDINLSVADIANAPSFTFTWKGDQTKQVQCGTSAQYWQKILPQTVINSNDQLSMSYDKAALLSAIAIAREVETLEQRVDMLEKENALLKSKLNSITTK